MSTMMIKSGLLLIFFMSWNFHNSIHAEVIRGVDVQRLDTSRLVGKWYLLTKASEDGPGFCSTYIMARLSDDSYTTDVTLHFSPDSSSTRFITATLQNDTSIVLSTSNVGIQKATAMFDVDYDSHMAIYVAKTKEDIISGRNGRIFILGRNKTLPEEVFNRVKQSNFYKEGQGPNDKLLLVDNSGC